MCVSGVTHSHGSAQVTTTQVNGKLHCYPKLFNEPIITNNTNLLGIPATCQIVQMPPGFLFHRCMSLQSPYLFGCCFVFTRATLASAHIICRRVSVCPSVFC